MPKISKLLKMLDIFYSKMILSFDIGTTNIKALLYQGENVIRRYEVGIKTTNNTQNPNEILSIVKEIINKESVNQVIITTAMHSLILLDENMEAVGPMYLWSSYLGDGGQYSFYEKTGVPDHSMTAFNKLLYLDGYHKVSDLKAFLMYNLVGVWVTDITNACASGMFNIHTLSWDNEILSKVNLTNKDLPIVQPIDTVYKCDYYDVILGSSDGAMANLGIQNNQGDLIVSIGTSVAVRKLVDAIDIRPNGFCYRVLDQYLVGSSSNNGGNLFDTFDISFETMIDILYEPLTDAYVLPYVYGERGPWYKEGLKYEVLQGTVGDIRDRVQSLIFAMFSNIEIMMETLSFDDSIIYVTGGFLRDQRMLQLFANYLNKEILFVANEDAVCRGNILLVREMKELDYIRCLPSFDLSLFNYKKTSISLIKSKILDVD